MEPNQNTLKALRKLLRNLPACEVIKHHAADLSGSVEHANEVRLYEVVYMALTMLGAEDATSEAALVVDELRYADEYGLDGADWLKYNLKL